VPSLELRPHNQTANNPLGRKLTEFAIIAAVADGRRPERMAEDEEIPWDLCNELLHKKSVSDPTYARAPAKFSEAGVVDAASLEGYHTHLSMVMNTARSPLPANVKPPLAAFPR